MASTTRPPAGSRHPLRVVFLALLGFWLLSPLLLTSTPAQDGPAFIAAARLARSDTAAVYGARWNPDENQPGAAEHRAEWDRWTAAYCAADPTNACEQNHAGFLSPPPSLFVYLPMTWFDARVALLLTRLLAAGLLVAGMEVLWRTLRPRDDRLALVLVLTAVLTTPVAVNIITLGQNTGFIFVSACLGVGACTRSRVDRRVLVTALVLSAAIVLKMFPALLVIPLLTQRRWRLLGTVAICGAAWLVLGSAVFPLDLWRAFADSLAHYRDGAERYSYNRSLDAVLHATVWPGLQRGLATTATLAARVVALAAIWFARVRKLDDDTQWAFVWLAAVAMNDYVWPHYFVLLLPLAAFIVRRRPALAYLLPVAGGITLVLVATWPYAGVGHVLAALAMLGALFGAPFLAPPAEDDGRAVVGGTGFEPATPTVSR